MRRFPRLLAGAALVLLSTTPGRADVFTNGSNTIYQYTDAGIRVRGVGFSEEYADVEAGPDGFVYATSNMLGYGWVQKVNPATGEVSTVYAPSGSEPPVYTVPFGLAFGTGGRLFVGSNTFSGPGVVLRFEPTTRRFVPFAFPAASGGVKSLVTDLAVAPNGDLYIAVGGVGVVRSDGTTGATLGTVVPERPGEYDFGYRGSRIGFGPDGNLYVSDLSNNIDRIDPASGAALGTFVPATAGGAHSVDGFSFGADGGLYVASGDTLKILRYDAGTGAYLDVFTSDAGTVRPFRWDVAYVPEPAAGLLLSSLFVMARRGRRGRAAVND